MKVYPYAVGRTYRYRQSQRQRIEKRLDSDHHWVEPANHPFLSDTFLALQKKQEKYFADCQRVLNEFNDGTPLTAFGKKDRRRIKYYQKHGCFPPFVVL